MILRCYGFFTMPFITLDFFARLPPPCQRCMRSARAAAQEKHEGAGATAAHEKMPRYATRAQARLLYSKGVPLHARSARASEGARYAVRASAVAAEHGGVAVHVKRTRRQRRYVLCACSCTRVLPRRGNAARVPPSQRACACRVLLPRYAAFIFHLITAGFPLFFRRYYFPRCRRYHCCCYAAGFLFFFSLFSP